MTIETRAAIAPHRTPTVDEAWDGPGNVTRLRLDAEAAYYRRAFAWADPDADPATKGAYRFPHHEVAGNGTIGAANVRGAIAGVAVLNGARGGTAIPDADREGVYRHLAAHLRDADVQPPDLRDDREPAEYRSFPLELRAADEGARTIVGYAAVFDRDSVEMSGMRERIARDAFTNTLRAPDVRALLEHDPRWLLGTTRNGTLRLAADDHGLAVEIDPPDTTAGRDAVESLRRGDLTAMSFAFVTVRDSWATVAGAQTRTLEEVRLLDVSLVAFPAYPDTSVALRSLRDFISEPPARRDAGLARRRLDIAEREV